VSPAPPRILRRVLIETFQSRSSHLQLRRLAYGYKKVFRVDLRRTGGTRRKPASH
jgi:hypothetical protein